MIINDLISFRYFSAFDAQVLFLKIPDEVFTKNLLSTWTKKKQFYLNRIRHFIRETKNWSEQYIYYVWLPNIDVNVLKQLVLEIKKSILIHHKMTIKPTYLAFIIYQSTLKKDRSRLKMLNWLIFSKLKLKKKT
jgi:hypothetical protein